ncbi:MAG TPA: DcaP family trimeric outer membrane transporter [Anaeromyxobacteraceae bacterium]|nr:DcaP family trimeric outer membrane transporter [Anaeromyxobacteraceae bacterium]
MNRFKFVAAILLAAAIPAVGAAEDAPGVFKIPGTESTIKFYGYTQLDTTLDFSGRVADYEDADWATILPLVPANDSPYAKKAKPQLYLTARTSRFGIQTTTPTKLGNVGVRLEGDFNGPNGFQSETFTNSVLFRLRHAYGTVGNLLVGQTWTTFLDFGAAPDTVDFNGPGTLALVRNPMIRYTIPLGSGMNLALAAENRRGPQFSANDGRYQTLPDLHANFSWNGDKGTFSARLVTQRLNNFDAAANTTKSAQSVAFGVSGSAKVGGDTVLAQFAGGPGVGRYLLNAITTPFFDFNAAGDMKLWSVYGAHAAYTHVWNPEFRSTAVVAYTFVVDPKIDGVVADNGVQKEFTQVFANTFWSFAKNAEFGVEYAWGQWKSFGPNAVKGDQNRVNASFHYNFF